MAVVGIGLHAYRNILPTITFLPVTLKAICGKENKERGNFTANQYGCRYYCDMKEMLTRENIDAVFICVSAQMHPQLVCEALDAGLHVWVEKPVAMHSFEIEEMICHRKDRAVVVGFKKIFMPSAQKVIEILKSGRYKSLESILAIYPCSLPKDGRVIMQNNVLTRWLENGCHPLSLMLSVGGEVGAVTTKRGFQAGTAVILEFENGILGNLHLASGPQPIENYKFFGDDWHMSIENSLRVTLQRDNLLNYEKTTSYIPCGENSGAIVWDLQNSLSTLENKAAFTQGIFNEMMYFCQCVLQGKVAKQGSLEFAYKVMRVYEATLISNDVRTYL